MAPVQKSDVPDRIARITAHLIDIEADEHFDLRYNRTPTEQEFQGLYREGFELTDVGSLEDAYLAGQRDRNPSASKDRSLMPADVLEVETPDGDIRYFQVAPVGFEEVTF